MKSAFKFCPRWFEACAAKPRNRAGRRGDPRKATVPFQPVAALPENLVSDACT